MFRIVFLSALVVFAASDPTKTIVGNAVATPQLSTLVKVLTSKGYEGVLKALNSPGTFTVFAPNDDAFSRAHVDPSYVDLVTQVLYYHVLGSVVKSSDLAALQFPHTLMSSPDYVNIGKGTGQVLEVVKNEHGVFIRDGQRYAAKVVIADVVCSNGVVHIIDEVLFFADVVSKTAVRSGLHELVAAVAKAKLVAAVDNTTSLTIFAPTDDALNKAGWDKLSISELTAVLTYHVVPAVAYSTEVKTESLPTLNGKTLSVTVDAKGIKVNGIDVVMPNVLTKNGVVHVIDGVLIPPSFKNRKIVRSRSVTDLL